jgi:hypothetical protein
MANFYGSYIGFGAGGAAAAGPFFLGESFGYIYGGTNTGAAMILTMEKHSMTADTNATTIGDMLVGRLYMGSANRSETHGYTVGGYISGLQNTIEKWQFSTDGNSTDVDDLAAASTAHAGSSSETHCYIMGGGTALNHIQRIATASDVAATDVGDCPQQGTQGGGASSETHGYKLGGWTSYTNIHGGGAGTVICIQKVLFAATATAADVAHISDSRSSRIASSSETHGYLYGGEGGGTVIDKHEFATDNDSTTVGTCTSTNAKGACASSAANGYLDLEQQAILQLTNVLMYQMAILRILRILLL